MTDGNPQLAPAIHHPVATAPVGFILSISKDVPGQRIYFGDGEVALVVDRASGKPTLYDDFERILSYWVAMSSVPKDPDCEVMGTWIQEGRLHQGHVAVGPAFMLLTDKYLRCSMLHQGTRVLQAGQLRPLTAGVYAFLFALAEVEQVLGGRKAVGIINKTDGIMVSDAAPATETWDHSIWHNKTGDFAAALMTAILDAKQAFGNERQRKQAEDIKRTDYLEQLKGRFRPATFDFVE